LELEIHMAFGVLGFTDTST